MRNIVEINCHEMTCYVSLDCWVARVDLRFFGVVPCLLIPGLRTTDWPDPITTASVHSSSVKLTEENRCRGEPILVPRIRSGDDGDEASDFTVSKQVIDTDQMVLININPMNRNAVV